ncbi:MAG: dihydroorotate dehydrogenase-like protein [Bacteroidales bacterium]|nr:dihydroorotate dehydrogenase-like protein [Bacteroidales bacterium]
MSNINTSYLGLSLKSPIIVGSSPLTANVDSIVELAEAGAGAVVLKSLFEEQILMDVDALRVNNASDTYADAENYFSYFTREKHLQDYLNLIKECKAKTGIPIIASINCSNVGEWVNFAVKMQDAGADAIELNIFNIPADKEYKGSEYEKIYFDVIQEVSKKINIPLSIKVSSYFSGMANFITKLSQSALEGIVLFNRFYEPDVDINKLEIKSKSFSSLASDNSEVLRWLGILSPIVKCDLCASTGIVNSETMIKNLLVGAKATMVVSQILKEGPQLISKMNEDLKNWMTEKGFENTRDFIGKLNQKNIQKPIIFERTQFMRYFHDADFVK